MKQSITKFKNCIKEKQSLLRKEIKKLERESLIITKLVNCDASIFIECGIQIDELDADKLFEIVPKFAKFSTVYLHSIEEQADDKEKFWEELEKEQEERTTAVVLKHFNEIIRFYNTVYSRIQSIINAFENDKIKEPITDIQILLLLIYYTDLTAEEANEIIGMTISFNSRYAKKHQDANINEITTINRLAEFYNEDGAFNDNADTLTYEVLIKSLYKDVEEIKDEGGFTEVIFYTNEELKNNLTSDDLVELLFKHVIENGKNKSEKISTLAPIIINKESNKDAKLARQELRKYYKNNEIIEVPENLEEFDNLLVKCELDSFEVKHIKELLKKESSKKCRSILTVEQQQIFENSLIILQNLDYSNNDIFVLNELINELQAIIDLAKDNPDNNDIELLLSDIPNIICQLSVLCSKYDYKLEDFRIGSKKRNRTKKKNS